LNNLKKALKPYIKKEWKEREKTAKKIIKTSAASTSLKSIFFPNNDSTYINTKKNRKHKFLKLHRQPMIIGN